MSRLDKRCIHAADLRRTHLFPALQQAEAVLRGGNNLPPWLHAPLIGRMLEAVSWLNVGTTCRYYREEDTLAIIRMDQQPLDRVIGFYRNSNMSAFTPALERSVFETVEQPYINKQWELPDAQDNEDTFKFGLLMSQALTADPLAEICCLFITFVDETGWQTVTAQQPTAVDVEAMLSNQFDSPAQVQLTSGMLAAGFLRVLEHMARSEAYFRDFGKTGLRQLLTAIGMLQAWRLKLRQPETRLRFDFLTRMIRGAVGEKSLGSMGSSAMTPGGAHALAPDHFIEDFDATVERLKQSWNQDHPLWLEAAA